jgi:ribosomal protein S7
VTGQKTQVRGADRLSRTMHAASKDLETMQAGTAAYTELLARTGRGFAPVRTGALRASITVEQGTLVVASVRYAVPVEFGSRRRGRPAVRYMGRAVESTETERDRIYGAAADDITDQIKGA